MARIRTIKPGFFKNADLFDAERETGLPLRVAYAGLWTVADREGRFKWKPREIKTDVLPYDDCDMGAVLDALETRGFIVKYRCGDDYYGCIPKFKDHQQINPRESRSRLPTPDESHVEHASATRNNLEDDAQEERANPECDAQCEEGKEKYKGKENRRVSDASDLPPQEKLVLNKTTGLNGCSPDFEAWWDAYPVQKSREAAEKSYLKALSRASPEVLLAAANRYAVEIKKPGAAYAKYPQKWLDEGRWTDVTGPPNGAEKLDPKRAAEVADKANQILKRGKYAEH